MENFKHGRKTIQFWKVTGEVLGTNKYSETHVSVSSSGGGGGGYVHPQYGGHVNVQAPQVHSTSTSIVNHEFWLRTSSGEEKPVKLRGVDIPLRTGQKITIISAGFKTKKTGWYSILVNHSAKKHWFIHNAVQLNRLMALERSTGVTVLLVPLAFAMTLWIRAEPWRFPVHRWVGPFLALSVEYANWHYIGIPLIVAGSVLVARLMRKLLRIALLHRRLQKRLESLAQEAYLSQ